MHIPEFQLWSGHLFPVGGTQARGTPDHPGPEIRHNLLVSLKCMLISYFLTCLSIIAHEKAGIVEHDPNPLRLPGITTSMCQSQQRYFIVGQEEAVTLLDHVFLPHMHIMEHHFTAILYQQFILPSKH